MGWGCVSLPHTAQTSEDLTIVIVSLDESDGLPTPHTSEGSPAHGSLTHTYTYKRIYALAISDAESLFIGVSPCAMLGGFSRELPRYCAVRRGGGEVLSPSRIVATVPLWVRFHRARAHPVYEVSRP